MQNEAMPESKEVAEQQIAKYSKVSCVKADLVNTALVSSRQSFL